MTVRLYLDNALVATELVDLSVVGDSQTISSALCGSVVATLKLNSPGGNYTQFRRYGFSRPVPVARCTYARAVSISTWSDPTTHAVINTQSATYYGTPDDLFEHQWRGNDPNDLTVELNVYFSSRAYTHLPIRNAAGTGLLRGANGLILADC